MALKFKITTEEHTALADPLKAEYKAAEGDGEGFELDVDGGVPGLDEANKRLGEFRTNNVSLKKERDKLKTDLAAEQEANKTTSTAKDDVEKRLDSLEKERKTDQEALATERSTRRDLQFSTTTRAAAKKAGVPDATLADAVLHLRHVRGMRLDDDDNVASEDGDTSLEDALTAMRKETPYFFAESEGAGTSTGSGRPTPPGKQVASILDNEEDILDGKAEWKPEAE